MNAKEMFENICYRKRVSDDCILYENGNYIMCNIIEFCLKDKTIYSFTNSEVGREAKSLSVNELKAINKQCEELGWLEEEEKAETNYEHFKDEIVQNVKYKLAVVNGEPKPCEDTNCDECDFNNCDCCGEKRFEWLASPYKKPTYKLSQFEYDLLSVHKDYKTYNNIANQIHLFKMREKGYFKDVDTNIPIREILDNCEVIKR